MTEKPADARPWEQRLGRARLLAAAALWIERGWPLVLPLVAVASLFVSAAWLGLFRLLPDTVRLLLLAGFCLAGLAALYPLRFFRRPAAGELDRRIEAANALRHTPVRVQSDVLGAGPGSGSSGVADPFAAALWREHQRRMAAALDDLRGDLPRPRVPERDPLALRAAPALLFAVAFAFSFGPLGGRLGDAFSAAPGVEPLPPRIDAWVTPPAYTGKAPIFLSADQAAPVQVPAGSAFSLRVTGGAGDETLAFTDASGATVAIAPSAPVAGEAAPAPSAALPGASASRHFSQKLAADGRLMLAASGREVRSWLFAVTPDKPPVIRFSADPKRAVNGALELAYEVEDDYGATGAEAVFTLAEPVAAGARPLYPAPEMKLTLPRRAAQGGAGKPPVARTSHDLTGHTWAGARVTLVLKATDAAGQQATSEPKTFVLPEKPFANPLARAVVEHRRILSLDASRKPDVLSLIDAITLRPEDTIRNAAHYLGLMTGRSMLVHAEDDEQLRGVADYFWQMALAIENSGLTDAERRLRQAQEALKQALQNGASDEEIGKLMQELRQAMDQYLKEFAENARKNPNLAQQAPPKGQEMRQGDLEKMLNQIENLAKSGNRDQAQELLSQLQDMMNNLQAGRQPGESGQQDSAMRQQMDKLGEILRRQQEMMNETFRMDQMQRGDQGEEGEGEDGQEGQQGQSGQGKPMTPEEFAEALKQLQQGQGQLQGDLNALMKGLKGMGIQPGEGFGEAGEAMGEAEQSLGKGEGGRAVGEQGRALEALRKGAQDMMNQMQQAQQGDEGGSEGGGRQQNADRDPLGRPRATSGPDFGDSVKVPDEIDVQRARQILDAIRKRLGNALSPDLERSYLERLLELR